MAAPVSSPGDPPGVGGVSQNIAVTLVTDNSAKVPLVACLAVARSHMALHNDEGKCKKCIQGILSLPRIAKTLSGKLKTCQRPSVVYGR